MIDHFKSFIEQHNLVSPHDSILLAVSGGVDSAVMTHLFVNSGYRCAIAHCNFQLRGEESEADEAFVRRLAAEYELPIYVERFNTEDVARNEGISIQMAARKLRYEWFDEILEKLDFNYISTAHNLNDSVETCLINMTRGTGIRGLSGIAPANNKIIRPLLFATRPEILAFSESNKIRYREDSSNASRKYHRNRIRHDVIPALEEINPGFLRTMEENMERYRETALIFKLKVEEVRQRLFENKDNRYEINISDILDLDPLPTWLFELFSPFGFTRAQCADLEKLLSSNSGKQFISLTHILFKDRDNLFLIPVQTETYERYYLDKPGSISSLPFPMDAEIIDRNEIDEIPSGSETAFLDLDTIQFPLTIRKWMHGDYFRPLGMDQLKKVSDFFIDQKIPLPLKNRIWILASGKKIVWIMGLRIDDRFKITEKTSRILMLRVHSNS